MYRFMNNFSSKVFFENMFLIDDLSSGFPSIGLKKNKKLFPMEYLNSFLSLENRIVELLPLNKSEYFTDDKHTFGFIARTINCRKEIQNVFLLVTEKYNGYKILIDAMLSIFCSQSQGKNLTIDTYYPVIGILINIQKTNQKKYKLYSKDFFKQDGNFVIYTFTRFA